MPVIVLPQVESETPLFLRYFVKASLAHASKVITSFVDHCESNFTSTVQDLGNHLERKTLTEVLLTFEGGNSKSQHGSQGLRRKQKQKQIR